MLVAIYARVSTDMQELDNQLNALRTYAQRQSWTIVAEYTDVISGKETARPGFDKLFIEAHQHKFDTVLFWDLSRFSRAGLEHTIIKLRELERENIAWVSYTEPYFNTMGQFKDVLIAVMATLAKIEREKISERTKAGLARARAAGKLIGKRGKDQRPRKRRASLTRR
jgi:DNA invertase Pin-like site-specific DNA recombinase